MFEVTDVFGEAVSLPASRWHGHILASHPEMRHYLDHIQEAITQPHCVYSSETDPNARLFYRRGIDQGRYRNLYLKVVVSYAVQPAEVKTAFFTAALTGGNLLWIQAP